MAERDPHETFSDAPDVDVERLVRLAVRAGINYREAPKADPWTKWMLGVCGVLTAIGITGAVAMYGKLTAIEANQITQATQVNRLESQIDILAREVRAK